ncbi:MAG: hypothetical protein GXO32_02160 [Crenarchaeota archaeon]|nr:hypothetical protein [Thermoproteota archaeon]
MPREWWHAPIGHIIRALRTLYRAEREGRELSFTELIEESRIPETTFYRTIKRALIEGGFITIETNPRERVMVIKLTEKGRKLAQCLEEAGIEV